MYIEYQKCTNKYSPQRHLVIFLGAEKQFVARSLPLGLDPSYQYRICWELKKQRLGKNKLRSQSLTFIRNKYNVNTIVSRVSTHGRLNIHVHVTHNFGDINCIRLHRSCYIEMQYVGTYPGVGACLGHYGTHVHVHVCTIKW